MWIVVGCVMCLHFFIMGCLVGHNIATGVFPRAGRDSRATALAYMAVIIFWPMALIIGCILDVILIEK
jgi:hypothetical protein